MRISKRGITLIELIVVMVIIAIGAVLMVPNLRPWIENYRLRTAARDLVSTMRAAQVRAVSNNVEYRVLISGGSFTLQRNSAGTWVDEEAAKTLPAGITIRTNTFVNPTSPLFRPNSSSNGGTIVLENRRNSTRTITVSPTTARITIQ